MDKKYLISETTEEQRKKIVEKALGISLLGTKIPSDFTLALVKKYIKGEIELEKLQKDVLERYRNGGINQ